MVEIPSIRGYIPYSSQEAQITSPTSMKDGRVAAKKPRHLGSIYTPPDFAYFLTSWAIKNSHDQILDVGIGEGIFVFTAYQYLLSLGTSELEAQKQIHGAEIDIFTYEKFIVDSKIRFPNVYNRDFFKTDFPLVDAVIGNPPYVRRTYMENIDEIRQVVVQKNTLVKESSINRMTDLYIYFLLHALSFLCLGGRLAVITADPWLSVGYGEVFKDYLMRHFQIEALISLDRRVFSDAEVKPVLLLATRKDQVNANHTTHFIRIKNGLPINRLQKILDQPDTKPDDVIFSMVKASELHRKFPWSIHFKVPEIYNELATHSLMTPMSNIAETRIGHQTLAKEFFVLAAKKANESKIEQRFLEPLAQSLRYFSKPTIEADIEPDFYLFYCADSKEKLNGTNALEYIKYGETKPVAVRGKNVVVIGYQNKERIKKAHRIVWYDLKTHIQKRGRASILIPRLVYQNFRVLWNKARFVPGELFIEFLPRTLYDDEVYLAVLNSSVNEILLRAHAQVYGGGTYNINPGEIKSVPLININLLTDKQRADLKRSYLSYLSNAKNDRSDIDKVVFDILGFNDAKRRQLGSVLEELLVIATSSNQPSLTHS